MSHRPRWGFASSTPPTAHLPSPPSRGSFPANRRTLMAILDAPADTRSLEFRANAVQMRELAAELDRRRAEAALGGPASARERHTSRGKLLPRDRVLRLIDPGSP